MATVKLVEQPVDIPPPRVVLDLSYQEAMAIMAVLGSVGGWHENSIRQLTDPIYYRLDNLGLHSLSSVGDFVKSTQIVPGRTIDELPIRPGDKPRRTG